MRFIKSSISRNLIPQAVLCPLAPIAPRETLALSKWIGRGLALGVLALGIMVAAPEPVFSQRVTFPITLPVDDALGYRPDEILISIPGRAPVLRSDIRSQPKLLRKKAKPERVAQARLPSSFLTDTPLLFSEFLRQAGPSELRTPIALESTTDVEAWCNEVLGKNCPDTTRTSGRDLYPSLPCNALLEACESRPARALTVLCPRDVVDRFDLSSIDSQPVNGPPSMTLRAANFRLSWAAQGEIEELAHERDLQPSIPIFTIEPMGLLKAAPQETPQKTTRAVTRRR